MKTTIWLIIILLPFFNFFIYPNISFADIGLVIGCVSLFFHNKKTTFNLRNVEFRKLLYFFIWVVSMSFLLIIDDKNNYINPLTFVTSCVRFLMIMYLFFNIKFLLRNKKSLNYLIKVWVNVVYFVCFLALLEYFLQFFGIYYSYYIEGITTTTSRQLKEAFRVSSIFNEPSYLSIYLSFSLLVILEFLNKSETYSKKKLNKFLIITCSTIVIAKSFVGVILMLLIIFIFKNLIFIKGIFKRKISIFFIFSVFAAALYFINIDRIKNIYDFQDGSANHRVLGAWELSRTLFYDRHFITGVGLGQQKNYLAAKSYQFDYHWFMDGVSTNSGVNNMFTLILFQTGIIGLILYVRFLFSIFKNRKTVFLFLLISGFGWAFTFNPLYWFCISVLHFLINGRKKNLIYIN